MRTEKLMLLCLAMFLFPATVAHAQTATPGQATGVSAIKASDFAWMTGRWIGRLDHATAEQICSTPQAGEMLCLFRVFVQGRPVMFELYSLLETPAGPELRSLHYSTDLVDKRLQQPLVMKLQKYSEKEVVFVGVPGSEVDSSTLVRDTATTMNGLILFKDQAQPHIRVRWEKIPYDAKINYNPAPAD